MLSVYWMNILLKELKRHHEKNGRKCVEYKMRQCAGPGKKMKLNFLLSNSQLGAATWQESLSPCVALLPSLYLLICATFANTCCCTDVCTGTDDTVDCTNVCYCAYLKLVDYVTNRERCRSA